VRGDDELKLIRLEPPLPFSPANTVMRSSSARSSVRTKGNVKGNPFSFAAAGSTTYAHDSHGTGISAPDAR
jgi:hypothetical protein